MKCPHKMYGKYTSLCDAYLTRTSRGYHGKGLFINHKKELQRPFILEGGYKMLKHDEIVKILKESLQ